MSSKQKHLEFIQGIINRMAANSFQLKGWNVVLVSALFVLSGKDAKAEYAVLAFLPALVFWGLDAYFLRQERLYRKLYVHVCSLNDTAINFDMSTARFGGTVDSWASTAFSRTLLPFHGAIVITVVIVALVFT
ncbi:hypothetical protein ACFL6M_04780 [Candidatus Eisenbacteria bacterium]|uniref:Uncharacterized protein n=1 Tax=Eiseniibacteriota bacterium TaxID=2212470 RepID=A0ABV6YKM5_UNCEI